ncbi:AraC family transcriptional regulator [Algibacter pectinivorans]|uniref:AraC-type DNA-binding protein n=1 Tax=Algibacter pectinivorans TaxID=870482 RepID=A0A1I1Q573_9FLAO|nr:AraC family transcriptional regulator [Algibacter pectinivorans]SFD17112.1 AraC-type DNA-binding protein [Algibacter pectinivorans]
MDINNLKEGFLGQKMVAFPKPILEQIKNNPISKNFYISDLGYYPVANHHFRSRKKGSKEFIFIYCTKGKGEIIINNKKTLITPNSFFIIPKKTKHEYKADDTNPWSIYWFHFNGPFGKEIYNRYSKTDSNNYKNISFSKSIIDQFNKIFDLFNNNYLLNHIEYANLLSLNFISSFVYYDFQSISNTQQNKNLVDSVKDYLLNNLDKNFTLDELASKFNYSKSYLHSKFKLNTGYPVLVFFKLKKVQKACEYLSYTDLSIKEISYQIGFNDPLYFSRIFKSFMGKSPRNYKQSQRK